jgi:hypothetical protein
MKEETREKLYRLAELGRRILHWSFIPLIIYLVGMPGLWPWC